MTRKRQRQRRQPAAARRILVEQLERRQLLAVDVHHNAFDPEDVNDDGALSPLDALIVINEMNSAGPRGEGHFVDVNGDGQRSPLDALMVINRLNRGGGRDRGNDNPEVTPAAAVEVRSFDGTGNNLDDVESGSTGQQLLRVVPADYADGLSAPAGEDRPSAREISNALSDQGSESEPNDRDTSAFLYVWGQFLDHDIDLTEAGGSSEAFDILIPAADPFFDPDNTGTQVIPFTRSQFDEATGTDPESPRQQVNSITAWIDGSMIYGSDSATADSLRLFEGGRLLVGDDGLLPTDEAGHFLAGDIRAGENIALTAIQSLFVREHNLWADRIAADRPELSDEEIFQRARSMVIAEVQAITFNEFLPALLGSRAVSRYDGYDPTVDPSIANEFSTAAFRFGHSSINDDIEFFADDGRPVRDEVELREAFFNPDLLRETGIDSILKYDASSQSAEIDLKVVDSLRNFLFGAPGQGGLDLAALNIQRGRDHGLADYNSVREAYGLPRVATFEEITSDGEVAQTLADLYGSVDNIDLWVGGLAEDHVRGSSVGPTFQQIITDQFERLRAADRLWYQNVYTGSDLRRLERTTLGEVIERNTNVGNLQDNVFFFRAAVRGEVLQTGAAASLSRRGGEGVAGVTVELVDDEGTVVAVTETDRRGRYRFDEFAETGDYQVRIPASVELGIVDDVMREFLISRGDQQIRSLDLNLDVNLDAGLLDMLAEDVT